MLHEFFMKASFFELRIILKNIKLGKSHLQNYLTDGQLKDLLSVSKRKINTRLHADAEEKSGNVFRLCITIITSSLGAWMGVTDFLLRGERTVCQFIGISVVSVIVSMLIGLFSYRFIGRQTEEACFENSLINLQIFLLKRIIKKKKRKLVKLHEKIKESLIALGFRDTELEIHNNFLFSNATVVDDLLDRLKEKIYEKWRSIVGRSLTFPSYLNENIMLFSHRIKNFNQNNHINGSGILDKERIEGRKIVESFAKSVFILPNPSVRFFSWLVSHLQMVVIGASPTAIGVFSGMFVFLEGLPNSLKKLDILSRYATIYSSTKYFILGVAILFTIYLTASQCKAIHQAYLRSKTIELAQIATAEHEIKDLNLSQQSALLTHFYNNIKTTIAYLTLAEMIKKKNVST